METIINILYSLHPEYDYKNSKNFVEDGFLNSFDIIALVTDLEEQYKISIDALDIVPEYFENVETIIKLLEKNGVKA